MAPNKKKGGGRNSNNNKKKGKGTKATATGTAASQVNAAATIAALTGSGSYEQQADSATLLRNLTRNTSLPTFHAPPSMAVVEAGNDDGATTSKGRPRNGGNAAKNKKGARLAVGNNLLDGKIMDGYYDVYKKATRNFWNWMKEALQTIETIRMESSDTTHIHDRGDGGVRNNRITTVEDLVKAADEIMQHNLASLDSVTAIQSDFHMERVPTESLLAPILIPGPILEDLTTSIYFREMVFETRYGGSYTGSLLRTRGDTIHRLMVRVLKYCRSVLKFSRRVAIIVLRDTAKMASDYENGNDKERKAGEMDDKDSLGELTEQLRRAALQWNEFDVQADGKEGEDDDNNNVTEESIRNREIHISKAPQMPKEDIDVEKDLVNGDDRFQAAALLRLMNDLMGAVAAHYGLLKNLLRGKDPKRNSSKKLKEDGRILKLVMECAVATNMAVESVRFAELDLIRNHPHLSSFYHVVSLVCLPAFMSVIENIVDPSRLEKDPNLSLNFVAEIVECSFHNKGDERIPAKVKRFAKRTGANEKDVETETDKIHKLTAVETTLFQEERLNAQEIKLYEAQGLRPHMWLENNPHIGGNNCILNTQCIVQKLMDLIHDSTKLVGKPGFWGSYYDEDTNPAQRIRGDLDEPFAGCIMPELIELCKVAPFRHLPERSQLITVLDLLQDHVRGDRTSPIPISLTFGLHAILTSMLVLQGDGDIARVAACSKQSFTTIFQQLNDISDKSKYPENTSSFYRNVDSFKNLFLLAKTVREKYDQRHLGLNKAKYERIAFWNPVIGGEYLLYGTYMSSFGLGSATVDSRGQLRLSLHLYNALKVQEPSFQIPLLDDLEEAFAKSRAVWVEGRPQISFGCHFFMSFGMDREIAERINADLASIHFNKQPSSCQKSFLKGSLSSIHPEDFSASYRLLVTRDFSDMDELAKPKKSKGGKTLHEGLFGMLACINKARDSFDVDDRILSLNLPAVGCILLEYTNALSEHMGWDAVANQELENQPPEMRSVKLPIVKHHKEGGYCNSSGLSLERMQQLQMYGAFLSQLDCSGNFPDGIRKDSIQRVISFTTNFFSHVEKKRYIFFVEKKPEKIQKPKAFLSPLVGVYPFGRTGQTQDDPLQGFFHFKTSKEGNPIARLIKPGKYTPLRPSATGDIISPYEEVGSKMRKRTVSRRYRHIASYNLEELVALGWDGAKYKSTKGNHEAKGEFVPFVVGYDSEEEDEYEPINVGAGKKAGIIGLADDEKGLWMTIPDRGNPGKKNLVVIN